MGTRIVGENHRLRVRQNPRQPILRQFHLLPLPFEPLKRV